MTEEKKKLEIPAWGSSADEMPEKPQIDLSPIGDNAKVPPTLDAQPGAEPERELSEQEQKIRNVILDVTMTELEKADAIIKIRYGDKKRSHHPAAKPDGEGRYVFPGLDGIPYRNRSGIPPELRDKDTNRIRPRIVNDAHVRVFDLNNKDDMEDYCAVMQKCARDIATISHEDIRYVEDKGHYICFLRWTEKFLEDQNAY